MKHMNCTNYQDRFSGLNCWRALPLVRLYFGVLLAQCICLNATVCGEEFSREGLDFFEARIRPVLVSKCYGCHSVESGNSEGGLLLDSRAGLLEGGGLGPAVVPGKTSESLLLKALRYQDEDLQMPPEDEGGQLAEAVIVDFEKWISIGAPDPRETTRVAPAKDWEAASRHWAFQPVRKPSRPGKQTNPVDDFIITKLEEHGLSLNPKVDKRTLLRRVTYGLTGLPPTYKQTEAFLADDSHDGYADVVERLLANVAYGERWGRYWLDVARYADTRGYRTGGKQERYSFSHTYRDYVIKAFNDDKPFNQFIIEQLAADQLELGDDKSALAAMGFLTLGRRFIDNGNLIIDDRIDTVTRGLMGLTVSCARCHDHKFDPIPTADYYSLHGVFASSEEPGELPLLRELDESSEQYQSYLTELRKLETEMEEIKNREVDKFLTKHRAKLGDYLLAAHDSKALDESVRFEEFAGQRDVDARLLRRWVEFLDDEASRDVAVLAEWFTAETAELKKTVATKLNRRGKAVSVSQAEVEEAKQESIQSELREFLFGKNCPSNPSRDEVAGWQRRIISNETARHRRDVEALNWKHDGAPLRAQVLVDKVNPRNSKIFKRGDEHNRGEEVPRQFVQVLAGAERTPFTRGSGRFELAHLIAADDNPLTARVFVNRVWGWHFGKPLVDTPSDFGVRTKEPRQVELLNWLAATFVERGWSVKELHRQIVLSQTYQQSSRMQPAAFEIDPENLLWHHMPRRRLQFEAMRDTVLAVSGTLDRKLGGIAVDVTKTPSPPRRTVYAYIDRQNLPGLLRTFDYPNPDATSPGRFSTTVPQQALFMLNSPFVVEQARSLVGTLAEEENNVERINQLYQRVLQRKPTDRELQLAEQFLRSETADDDKLDAWELYAQTLLMSNELFFVD